MWCLPRLNNVCNDIEHRVRPSHVFTDDGIIGMDPNIHDLSDEVSEDFGALKRVLGILINLHTESKRRRVERWIKDRIQGTILSKIAVDAEGQKSIAAHCS